MDKKGTHFINPGTFLSKLRQLFQRNKNGYESKLGHAFPRYRANGNSHFMN